MEGYVICPFRFLHEFNPKTLLFSFEVKRNRIALEFLSKIRTKEKFNLTSKNVHNTSGSCKLNICRFQNVSCLVLITYADIFS